MIEPNQYNIDMEVTTDLTDIKVSHTVIVGERKSLTPQEVMDELSTQEVLGSDFRFGGKRSWDEENDPALFFQENFIHLNKTRQEVNIALVTVESLMMKNERNYLPFREIKQRAKTHGLIPCPKEVPVALRLQRSGHDRDIYTPEGFVSHKGDVIVVTQPFKY